MWKNELIEKLYPITVKNHDNYLKDMDYAYNFKNKNIPKKLFKYNWLDNGDNYSLENFVNDQVYLNNPKNFNDIFDCRSWIDINKLAKENGIKIYKESLKSIQMPLNYKSLTLRQFIRSRLKSNRDYRKFKNISQKMLIENLKNAYKKFETISQESTVISCFSETIDSNLMWSHYSNKHYGFVLEYNFKELGYKNVLNRSIYPVIYKNTFFDLTDYFLKNGTETLNIFYLNLPILIKSSDWKYEKEWRLIIGHGVFKEGTLYHIQKPKAIYLGIRISLEHKKILINIAKSKGLKIYQMITEKNRYGLKYVEIKY